MERIEGLSIGLDLDSLSLERGLAGLKDRMKTLNSEMKASLSSFDRADKSVEKYETTLTGLNKKLELQKRIVSESKAEYEKMVKEHGEGSKEAEAAARSYNNQVSALNNLERRIEFTTKELQQLQAEQKQTISEWEKFQQSSKKAGETLTGVSEKLKNVGQTFSTSLTAPLIGFSVFAGKTALEFDAAAGVIQSELGETGVKVEKLQRQAEELWKKGFGENVEGVAVKIAGVTRALGDLNDVDLSNVVSGLDLFEKRGWADQTETLRALKVLMEQFGLSASKAMDYLTRGFQENLDYSGEFLDSISEYSTYYAEMGLSVDDMFARFKAGAETGAFQLDKIGDAMKEFTLRAKDGSKTSAEAFQALGLNANEMTRQFNAGGETAKKAFETVVKAIQNTKDETTKNAAAVGLFGTQYEDLGEKAFDAMLQATEGLGNVEGATKRASDALNDNLGARAKKMWREFLVDMKPVGDRLLDFSEGILPKVADTVDKLTEAFANMSPEGQKTTLMIGGLVAALGPFLTVIGLAANGVSAIIGALGLLTGPVGITIGVLAALGLGFAALDSEMDKPIIKSDIFAGKVSETTKKILGEYDKLERESHSYLTRMATGNEEVTQEHVDNMVRMYQEMSSKILEQLDTRYQEERAKLAEMLNENQTLSDEDKVKTLAKFDEHYQQQRQQVLDNESQKIEITKQMQGATEQERMAHYSRLMEIDKQNAEILLQNTAQTKDEYLTIQRNLKNEADIISAEKAAKYVRDSKETTDKVIAEANKRAADEIAAIEYQRDVTGTISAEQAQKLIDDAQFRRDQVVATAQDEHMSVVQTAQAQAGEHADSVNWETGEVLTGWDKMYNGVITAINWIRELFNMKPLDKKGTLKENGRQRLKRQNAEFKARYAKGTPSTGHPGGPAIVGEEGIELAHIPNQGVTILGLNGPEFVTNLPKGTSVLPNKETERLLKSYGFPGYADGIGDYFDIFLKGAGNVWDFVKDKFNLSDGLIPSWINRHTGSPLKYVGNMATDWIKKLWDNWFGDIGKVSGGKGVERWRGVATKALLMTGQYTKTNLERLLYQMKTESGGNPRAINLWDSNAKKGIPSKGLMQVIDPTFKAYAMPGFNKDIYDPLSNILASIRYALVRYGSLAKAYRGVGYATGGLIGEEGLYRLAEGGYPEFVIPTDPARRTDAMKLLALAGRSIQGNKRPNQLPNVTSDGNNSQLEKIIGKLSEQVEDTKQIVSLLTKLLLKDTAISIDGRELAYTISPYVKDYINFSENRFRGGAS